MIRKLALGLLLIAVCACGGPSATPATPPATAVLSPTPVPSPTPTQTPSPSATPTQRPSSTSRPTPSPNPTETPAPAWPIGFQLGVHRDASGTHADLMALAGVTWVARQAWHLGGDNVGAGDFIAEAHLEGLKAFVTVTGDWERGYDSEYRVEYVGALAILARAGADAIEVWDQPNTLASMPVVDPAEYTALLCEAYAAIKEGNPGTLVISGAPAPTDSSADCTDERCGDVQWLEALFAAGAFECADMVGARYTSGATGPIATIGHPSGLDHQSFFFLTTVRRYHEASGGEKPLAFSQFGYLSPQGYGEPPRAFWWAADTSALDQAEWTAEAVQIASRGGIVGMLMIWNLDYTEWGGDFDSVQAGYALIRPDGSCPTCDSLAVALAQP